jgi:hypothetical protein
LPTNRIKVAYSCNCSHVSTRAHERFRPLISYTTENAAHDSISGKQLGRYIHAAADISSGGPVQKNKLRELSEKEVIV